jgi:hypothetical protein
MRIIFLVVFLTGCVSVSDRRFNSDDTQDNDCYNSRGGMRGYCDTVNHKGGLK